MISSRAEQMPPFLCMDVHDRSCALEAAGIDVVHLEVGEPDFDVPEPVRSAAVQALAEGHTHYTHSLGEPALREAIAAHYARTYGVHVHSEQVVVASGTSPAMLLLFGALLNPGDEVILSDPGYACYPNIIRFVGGVPVQVPVAAGDGFQLDPDAIAAHITPRTRAVMINSPANPTGNLLTDERMRALAALDVPVISDEIYHGLVYEGRERSILEFTERAFVLNGFSKAYAMTGLRLGYAIVPCEFVRPLQKLQQNLFISANSVSQRAAIVALDECAEDVQRMRRTYDERRRATIAGLRALGFGIAVPPTGAFYVFADARHLGSDSRALAFDILERAHVGVAPGIDFGPHGEGYLRFSYASAMPRITEGLARLRGYLGIAAA